MGNEKFIRCCVCDAIHQVSAFDKAPIYVFVRDEVKAQATDDWRLFMTQHAGHRLEPLKASGEKLFPMSVVYFEVTNGQDRYVVRRARKSIREPMSYELIRVRLADAGITVEVQERENQERNKEPLFLGACDLSR